jgi:hypothetical protein
MRGVIAARPGEDDRVSPARFDHAAEPLRLTAGPVHHHDQLEAALRESRLQPLHERHEERLTVLVIAGVRLEQEGDGVGRSLAQAAARLVRRVIQLRCSFEHASPRLGADVGAAVERPGNRADGDIETARQLADVQGVRCSA